MALNLSRLEKLYTHWNRPQFISPDPLETLAPYGDVADREVVAFLASSMAYGRVNALLPPLRRAIAVLGVSPRDYIAQRAEEKIAADLHGLVYRFSRPPQMAALLAGMGAAVKRSGSLEAVFRSAYQHGGEHRPQFERTVDGLKNLETAIRAGARGDPGHLLPNPAKGSACKRLNLFLRWMVRRDAVDPGGWTGVELKDLLPPLDTWIHRIALRAGWTQRRCADMKTVREVGAAFLSLNPEDPVKYDFALSRFGIRSGLNLEELFRT